MEENSFVISSSYKRTSHYRFFNGRNRNCGRETGRNDAKHYYFHNQQYYRASEEQHGYPLTLDNNDDQNTESLLRSSFDDDTTRTSRIT